MYSQFDRYSQANEVRNRQSNIMAEYTHQKMVDELKQGQQSEVSSRRSPRQLLGETLIKIGGWLATKPTLKEA